MAKSSLLFAGFCLSLGRGEHVQMELGAPPVPSAWTSVGATPREQTIELVFAVKQRGLAALHDTLMRVSTPSSREYGMHLTNQQVHDLTAPASEHLEAVEAFIRQHGVEPRRATPNGDMVSVVVPVSIAETMLSTRYVQFNHAKSNVTLSRTPDGYHLPSIVAAAVDFVTPTVHVPGVHRPLPKGLQFLGSGYNSPKNLRELYNIGDTEGKAQGNKQAVTAFLKQGYDTTSLQHFWNKFCDGITCGKGLPKLVGDATGGRAGVESMLDIETITGVAGNVESEFWGFSGTSPDNPENEPFLKWLVQMSSTSDVDVPKLFSTSYGEDEASWSYPAAQRLNVEFQKAGVRGITLLYASGDEGANEKSGKFVPEGPGSSPYVTAVGGTKPTSSWPKPGPDSESAIGLSSGGFSAYWPMPDYQKDAVAAYLQQSGLPEKSKYNATGRGYPDISAQATDFFVYADGDIPGVSGTSCATPAAAGIFALLNDLRIQQGKSTLGFLNPFIYAHAEAFNDITTGSSSSGGWFDHGWPAKKGWDAVTGVGTPDYASLAKIVMDLPAGRADPSAVAKTEVVV